MHPFSFINYSIPDHVDVTSGYRTQHRITIKDDKITLVVCRPHLQPDELNKVDGEINSKDMTDGQNV